jgi:hypothetical protein
MTGDDHARRAKLRVLTAIEAASEQAVVTIDGTEHRFRATGRQALDGQVHAFLHEEVARRQLRPVVLTEAAVADGPVRWTVWPDGSGSAEDAGTVQVVPPGPG